MTKDNDYDKYGKAYADLGIEDTFWLAYRDIPNLIRKYVKGIEALDYGCGAGRSTRFLKSLGFETIGLDISKDMIREAEKRDSSGKYEQIKSGLIPYPSDSFDFIFSSIVFLEIPTLKEMEKILRDMRRVLRPGGVVIIIDSTPEAHSNNWASFICDLPENENLKSGDKGKAIFRGTDMVLYGYTWTDKDHEKAFENAGLKLIEVRKPLASGNEPFKWYSETKIPVWVIYTLEK
jgi:ubiquinone/menaquinone biosynthesis C-methylase UbiE